MSVTNLTIGMALIAATAAPVEMINGQQTTTPTTASAEVTQCAQARMVVDQLLAGAMARLEMSRQANTAADMRATVDSLQNTMRDVRAQLAACASMQPAREAPMDHSKMPMGTTPEAKPAPSAKPVVPAPMDHSKMQMGTPAATKPAPATKPATPAPMDHSKMAMGGTAHTSTQATDPVCGLKVDPAVAPQASHQGKKYSFCSTQHRDLFTKNPAKYLPKAK